MRIAWIEKDLIQSGGILVVVKLPGASRLEDRLTSDVAMNNAIGNNQMPSPVVSWKLEEDRPGAKAVNHSADLSEPSSPVCRGVHLNRNDSRASRGGRERGGVGDHVDIRVAS
ncbi:hypothetical protein KM043_004326 [Ampulex compressa]|nr:hypothetical protein KM043_004326 [Ampulex compressa]